MPTEPNEDRVRDRKQRLLDRYDGVELVEEDELVGDELFASLREAVADGYVGSGYVWTVRTPDQAATLTESMPDSAADDGERILLILHRGNDTWTIPGGGVEDGETYEEAAVREVREETGIDCAVEDCFRLAHLRTTAEGYDEYLHTLWASFDGRYVDGTITIQAGELNGAAWFDARPASVAESLEERVEAWFDD